MNMKAVEDRTASLHYPPPSIRPVSIDAGCREAGRIELTWDGTSQSSNSNSTDDGENDVFDRRRSTSLSGRKRGKRGTPGEDVRHSTDEEVLRKRKLLFMAISFAPLLMASISLALVMTSHQNNDEGAEALRSDAINTAAGPWQDGSPTYAPSTASLDSRDAVGPPSSQPITTTIQQQQQQQLQQQSANSNNLRGSTPPTELPATGANSVAALPLPGSPDFVIYPLSTPSPSSRAPSSGPTTTEATCVASGLACPAKGRGEHCCSKSCKKDKDTGEKVCRDELMATSGSHPGAFYKDETEATCVESGMACPSKMKLCCSKQCSRGKVKKCK